MRWRVYRIFLFANFSHRISGEIMYIVSTKLPTKIHLEDKANEKNPEFKRFWKQLCPFGEWIDPNDWENSKLVIDEKLVDQMIQNFNDKVLDYVPVPLGHPWDSSALADLNTGELLELEKREDGLYGLIEIRDEKVAEKVENGLIPNVSMGFDLQYKDKKTGELKGAVLLHVGLVVDPYLKGMKPFEPVLSDSKNLATVVLSETNNLKKENKMFVKVKNDRDFDIEVKYQDGEDEKTAIVKAGEEIEVPADQEETVKQQIIDAVKPEEENEGESDEPNLSDEISNEKKALSEERAKLEAEKAEIAKQKAELSEKQAEANFEKLLSEGKVVPAQKESYLALCTAKGAEVHLSENKTKTVETLLSEFFEAMPSMRLLSEDGEGGEPNGEGEKDVELSETDKENIERFGLNEEEYKATKKELEGDK